MASSFRHRAVQERAYSAREAAALDEERGLASSFPDGWTGRADWTRADRNSLLYCHRRAAQVVEQVPAERQAA